MTDWVYINKDPQHIAREKLKAKKLRNSQWWKNKIARGVCHYCEEKFDPEELTMDHIVPLARGGESTKGNVVPCCKSCNNKKKHYTPTEMILDELKKQDADDAP